MRRRTFLGAFAVGLAAVPVVARARPGLVTPGHLPPVRRTVVTRFPEEFGAVGDGVADDTAALQRSLDTLSPGATLVIRAGRTYRHRNVLKITVAGTRLTGPGTLLSSAEQRSALVVEADGVTIDGGLIVRSAGTTRRWKSPHAAGLHLTRSDTVVRDVTVDGAGCAGVYVEGASHYLLENVTVRDSRSDGIHNTGGSTHGVIRNCTVTNSGDDGFAVVSYDSDAALCSDITFQSPRFMGNTWGRGFSVVGGTQISYFDVYGQDSNAAMVYVAAEPAPWLTRPSTDVVVAGGTLIRSNTNARIDHGAVLLYAGNRAANDRLAISGLTIRDTRRSAPFQVGLLADKAASIRGTSLDGLNFVGGPSRPIYRHGDVRFTRDGVSG